MKQRLHITAIASYKIYPAKMGGQKGIALFYAYLSRLVDVMLISTKNNEQPENLKAGFLPVLSNSRLRYVNPLLFFKIKSILKKYNSTHLIIEHPYYGWLGILLKWFCNIKLIVHSHNIESIRFKSTGKWWWKIMWAYEKMTHRKADINFFITDEDKAFAIKHFKLQPDKCQTITYGFELNGVPSLSERAMAKKALQQIYPIDNIDTLILFNGTLDYKPNRDALDAILENINPLLLKEKNFPYKIIICGRGLPEKYDELKNYQTKNIIYAGFVDDINLYFKGVDIFINPVTDGGGIKTKLVEALGYNLFVVSTQSGAIGVPFAVAGNKMSVFTDDDFPGFANAIINANLLQDIPAKFFGHFYWGNIAQKAVDFIS